MTLKKELIYLQLTGRTYQEGWTYLHARLQKVADPDRNLVESGEIPSAFKHCFQDYSNFESQVDQLTTSAFCLADPLYPKTWLHIPQPPLLLYYRGNLDLLKQRKISFVGSRKLSDYGIQAGKGIARALSQAGFVLVSGLAKGADAIAHQAGLSSKSAGTIAVIASGFNTVYPKEHYDLQSRIAQEQLLISEYPPQQGIRKHQFIGRNRLVAGLCPAIVVVQAANKSGSLITANYALDYNRQVYALPGPITDTQSYGTNALIHAGASPIYDLNEFVREAVDFYQRQAEF